MEINLRLEKVVASKQLRLAVEIEEERRARLMQLPNGSGWPLEKMVATTQLMLALIKGVVNVGVVLSLKPILETMLIIHRHPQLKENIDHELLSGSLILLYIYLITYTYNIIDCITLIKSIIINKVNCNNYVVSRVPDSLWRESLACARLICMNVYEYSVHIIYLL